LASQDYNKNEAVIAELVKDATIDLIAVERLINQGYILTDEQNKKAKRINANIQAIISLQEINSY
jgi:hypothetical protein